MKIFLDDERFPVDDSFQICRSMDEFKNIVTNNHIEYISFDHDLGSEETGYDCVKWLVVFDIDNNILSNDFDFYVHSQNPVGATNIREYLNNYLNFKRNS